MAISGPSFAFVGTFVGEEHGNKLTLNGLHKTLEH